MDNNTLLNQRYEIKEILGRGGLATTYRVFDHQNEQEYALKELSFQNIGEWKAWELAEREANILKSLNHPQIPDYIDFFTIETDQDTHMYLVQEYVDGQSLTQLVHENRRFTENDVLQIALGMSRILEYLHGFSPPIIHRDIKPSNIILSGDNQPFLIDFDNVKDTIQSNLQTSHGIPTIVGTYGYMPLEQTEGRAVPASDMYALGMTLIHLLSHKEPSQMEKDGLKLDFRPHVHISSGLADVLERMIAPDWQNRYQSATELRQDLERLQSGKAPVKAQTTLPSRPWLKYLIAADLLVAIVIAVGIYFWISRTPGPPASSDNVNAPPAPLPTQAAPINAASTPLPQKTTASSSKVIVYPVGDNIGMDIYRDFKYVPRGWPMGLSVGQSTAGGLDKHPYEELIREPEYRSKEVLYGYLPLGNGEDQNITFVLDELDRPHWTAYVDKNNNEDLTDDGPPYRNEGTGIFAAEVDAEIEIITFAGENTIQPYHLWMWLTKNNSQVKFYARCYYAGKIEIGENLYETVAFEQFNHNGLFRESGLWIDLNQDKKLDEETEHFQDGSMLQIDNAQYQLGLLYP